MKITDYLKNELLDFTLLEVGILIISFAIITFNALIIKDSISVIISAVCGILYTIIAGKGKFYCYLIGLCGSFCYSYISFKNSLYGNCLLYLCYYIPLQVVGFFSWRRHLKESSCNIIKTHLTAKHRYFSFIILISGSILFYCLLAYFKDSHPVFDAITTFTSVVAMFLTVKRCIEQWILWFIVNLLSFIMWLDVILSGIKAYSTLVMWGVYVFLAVYFFIMWKKEINQQKKVPHYNS